MFIKSKRSYRVLHLEQLQIYKIHFNGNLTSKTPAIKHGQL